MVCVDVNIWVTDTSETLSNTWPVNAVDHSGILRPGSLAGM